MTDHKQDVGPGYFRADDDGRLQRTTPRADEAPAFVVCRRVSDYPLALPPTAAGIGPCSTCGALVAFNLAGPHMDRPRVCMQCAQIKPLPFDGVRE